MAALTGDAPEMEGTVGTTGVSEQSAGGRRLLSADELPDDGRVGGEEMRASPRCHDDATSPESRLVGCAIQTCPEKVQAANPLRYVTPPDPPLMILHGGSDPLVPHNQGEQLYMALNKACLESAFISLPKAGHGPWNGFLTDDAIREAATIRSTSAAGCAVDESDAVHAVVEDRDRVPGQASARCPDQRKVTVLTATPALCRR